MSHANTTTAVQMLRATRYLHGSLKTLEERYTPETIAEAKRLAQAALSQLEAALLDLGENP